MKKWENRYKLNNRGMSLIEILVAIAILAIVTGPILHSFVTAIKLNAKAKENQRATTAAQSIMEGFKAYDLEELCWQFGGSHPFYVVANAGDVYAIDPNNLVSGAKNPSIVTAPGADGSVTEQFIASADNRYTFVLKDVNFEGKLYDAKIELEPLMTADIVSMKDVVVIEDFDVNTTAVYDQSDNLDAQALNAIAEFLMANDGQWNPDNLNYTGQSFSSDVVKEALMQSLHITVKLTDIRIENEYVNDGSGNYVPELRVNIYYKFSWSTDAYTFTYTAYGSEQTSTIAAKSGAYWYDSDGNMQYDWVKKPYQRIYPTDATTNPSQLQTISFCYYPAYNYDLFGWSGISIPNDVITISNTTSMDINVALIKQKNPNIDSEAKLRTLEENYSNPLDSASSSGSYTTDGSNLSENLADAVSVSGGGGNMLSTKTDVLIYSVKVSVYAEGEAASGFTGEPMIVLNGTMND